MLGTDSVAKSAPDGYTLLVTYAGSQAINASLYPKIPFDSVGEFSNRRNAFLSLKFKFLS